VQASRRVVDEIRVQEHGDEHDEHSGRDATRRIRVPDQPDYTNEQEKWYSIVGAFGLVH